MRIIDCDTEETLTFDDKLMGVFEDTQALESFASRVETSFEDEVELLRGAAGQRCLEKVGETVHGFVEALLGDMESGMLKVYLQAVEAGHTVFAIPVTSESRDEIVREAVQLGAKNLAHFGQLVNESFEHLTGDLPA